MVRTPAPAVPASSVARFFAVVWSPDVRAGFQLTVVFSFLEFAALYAATRSVAVPLTRLPVPATEPVPSPLSSFAVLPPEGSFQALNSATTCALARELTV